MTKINSCGKIMIRKEVDCGRRYQQLGNDSGELDHAFERGRETDSQNVAQNSRKLQAVACTPQTLTTKLEADGRGSNPLLWRLYHKNIMKTSIFFLGVFTAGLLTGLQVDWESFLWGLATGVSAARLLWSLWKE